MPPRVFLPTPEAICHALPGADHAVRYSSDCVLQYIPKARQRANLWLGYLLHQKYLCAEVSELEECC